MEYSTYSPRFLAAMPGLKREEGGHVNDKRDTGGETNFGIADLRDGIPDGMTDIDGDGKPDTRIKDLKWEDAQEVYWRDYWLECACNILQAPLDWMVFDAAVQHSPAMALRLLERSGMDARRFCEVRRKFYHDIVARQPAKKVFLRTWMRRMDHNEKWLQTA